MGTRKDWGGAASRACTRTKKTARAFPVEPSALEYTLCKFLWCCYARSTSLSARQVGPSSVCEKPSPSPAVRPSPRLVLYQCTGLTISPMPSPSYSQCFAPGQPQTNPSSRPHPNSASSLHALPHARAAPAPALVQTAHRHAQPQTNPTLIPPSPHPHPTALCPTQPQARPRPPALSSTQCFVSTRPSAGRPQPQPSS